MTKMDAKRIVKNFGYMAKSLPQMNECHFCTAGKAVLEHHFDNHEYCGAWCRRRNMTAEQRKASGQFYRCKVKDAELYKALHDIVSRFIEHDRLKESAHGMDTNVNESLNNTISYLAPKNRVFCSTRSLENRVAIVVGITSIGFESFFCKVFDRLAIATILYVLHWLKHKDKLRIYRITNRKQTSTKRNRMKRKFDKLKEEEEAAIRA